MNSSQMGKLAAKKTKEKMGEEAYKQSMRERGALGPQALKKKLGAKGYSDHMRKIRLEALKKKE